MKLIIKVEDDKGYAWSDIERGIDEGVDQDGEKILFSPKFDVEELVFGAINEAEDRINNWDKIKL